MKRILQDEAKIECFSFWVSSVTYSQKICASNQVLEFCDP